MKVRNNFKLLENPGRFSNISLNTDAQNNFPESLSARSKKLHMTNLFVEEKKKKQNHPNKPTKNPPKPSKQKRNELHLKLCGSIENVEGQEIYCK